MKSKIEHILYQSKKNAGRKRFCSFLLILLLSSVSISCSSTTEKKEKASGDSSTSELSKNETSPVNQEVEATIPVIEPYVFSVDNLLDTRMDKSQLSDYYIKNTGYYWNLYYID